MFRSFWYWIKNLFVSEVEVEPHYEKPLATVSARLYREAYKYYGLHENKDKKALEELTGYDCVKVAWCGAFMNAIYKKCNINAHTHDLWARSHGKLGREVSIDDAVMGNIVVLWRIDKDGPYGHVGFYQSHNNKYVALLGGNQSDKVSVKYYDINRILTIRSFDDE